MLNKHEKEELERNKELEKLRKATEWLQQAKEDLQLLLGKPQVWVDNYGQRLETP